MNYFGISTDRLVTTGVGPCVCFSVILNSADDKQIFIEHRSDAYFPSSLTLNNVRLYYKMLLNILFNYVQNQTLRKSTKKTFKS